MIGLIKVFYSIRLGPKSHQLVHKCAFAAMNRDLQYLPFNNESKVLYNKTIADYIFIGYHVIVQWGALIAQSVESLALTS